MTVTAKELSQYLSAAHAAIATKKDIPDAPRYGVNVADIFKLIMMEATSEEIQVYLRDSKAISSCIMAKIHGKIKEYQVFNGVSALEWQSILLSNTLLSFPVCNPYLIPKLEDIRIVKEYKPEIVNAYCDWLAQEKQTMEVWVMSDRATAITTPDVVRCTSLNNTWAEVNKAPSIQSLNKDALEFETTLMMGNDSEINAMFVACAVGQTPSFGGK